MHVCSVRECKFHTDTTTWQSRYTSEDIYYTVVYTVHTMHIHHIHYTAIVLLCCKKSALNETRQLQLQATLPNTELLQLDSTHSRSLSLSLHCVLL
jgi:hypothetical protein